MFCTNCGKEISEDIKFCPYCGTAKEEAKDNGYTTQIPITEEEISPNIENTESVIKYRYNIVAGVLAAFFGYLGFHNLYLRRIKEGVVQLLLFIVIVSLFLFGPWLSPNIGFSIFSIIFGISYILGLLYLPIWVFSDFIQICKKKLTNENSNIEIIYHKSDNHILIPLYITKIVIIVLIPILFICFSFNLISDIDDPIVKQVRESIYRDNITYEELISTLISIPKWEKINDTTVNVSGDISYNGEKTKLEIGFRIKEDNTVNIYAMELDNNPQNEVWKYIILERMVDLATSNTVESK